jgi:hypothetical protein
MSGHEEDLTPQEERALRALAEGPEAPAALEGATLARLRRTGALPSPRGARRTWLAVAAAGVAFFAVGLFVGGRRAAIPEERSSVPRFALFLYDAPGETPLDERRMEQRVEEYRSWARWLRARGHEIRGEKLEPQGRRLGPSGTGEDGWPLGGYFVISAKDLDAAVVLARSCPHLKHGGRVEVRAIART